MMFDHDEEYRANKWFEQREAKTTAALNKCPENIRSWLIECTASPENPEKGYSFADSFGNDGIEWFEVGHNATHYFSFGVRPDGEFIAKTYGPEYSEECQCWYDKTTVEIVVADTAPLMYWGH